MSVIVRFPVEVKEYRVSIGNETAVIRLRGVDVPADPSDKELKRVGDISFGGEQDAGSKDSFTRVGSLVMNRPLTMLPAILDLLRHEKPLYLHQDGQLSTSAKPEGLG